MHAPLTLFKFFFIWKVFETDFLLKSLIFAYCYFIGWADHQTGPVHSLKEETTLKNLVLIGFYVKAFIYIYREKNFFLLLIIATNRIRYVILLERVDTYQHKLKYDRVDTCDVALKYINVLSCRNINISSI